MTCSRLTTMHGYTGRSTSARSRSQGHRNDPLVGADHQRRAFERRLLVQLQNISFLAVVNAIRLERAVARLEH